MPKTPPVDADAQAFLTAAAITDPTISGAINTLVVQMKADGIWSKMKAIYPMVGGSASAHKFNLKDPRDLDAAFRLVFNGGITHDSNGISFNGTNGWANTYANTSNVVSNWHTSSHLSIYCRTKTPSGNGFAMGVGNTATGNPLYGLVLARQSETGSPTYYDFGNSSNNGRLTYPEFNVGNDARAFYIGSTRLSNDHELYKNLNTIASSTLNAIGTLPNAFIHIGKYNATAGSDFYQGFNAAMITMGEGLTDAEAANLYTRVQAFNTALSRQV